MRAHCRGDAPFRPHTSGAQRASTIPHDCVFTHAKCAVAIETLSVIGSAREWSQQVAGHMLLISAVTCSHRFHAANLGGEGALVGRGRLDSDPPHM